FGSERYCPPASTNKAVAWLIFHLKLISPPEKLWRCSADAFKSEYPANNSKRGNSSAVAKRAEHRINRKILMVRSPKDLRCDCQNIGSPCKASYPTTAVSAVRLP